MFTGGPLCTYENLYSVTLLGALGHNSTSSPYTPICEQYFFLPLYSIIHDLKIMTSALEASGPKNIYLLFPHFWMV
jgi:hypothetical protein